MVLVLDFIAYIHLPVERTLFFQGDLKFIYRRLDQVQQAGGGIAPPPPCPTGFKGDKEPLPFRSFYSIITEKFLVRSESLCRQRLILMHS